jgi:hypothetical protein
MDNHLVKRARSLAGVMLKDWRRYRRAFAADEASFLALCNRTERLEPAPAGIGYRCQWQWTSDLHAPRIVPALGKRMMARAFADHPIRRAGRPEHRTGSPEVSFVIGHRGTDRLPHLLATLESIAGQQGASVECVVVEQDTEARVAAELPAWVRHVHTPPPAMAMPYCRSWAFNIGVRHSHGSVLVLHDNDMLVPADYAANILRHVAQGAEVANLKRFIFYLSEAHTKRVFAGTSGMLDEAPASIVQNLEAGGSIAITRQAYDGIGGMDESFIGWGGEDNEFWERAQTRKVWPYAYLPLVHLWHAAQPGKSNADNPTQKRFEKLSLIPAEIRIERLRRCTSGNRLGPAAWGA